jgi:gluconolactonase
MRLLLFASWLALTGCRLNPECFGSSECPEGTFCFDRECVPAAPDGGTYTWWQDVEPIVRDRCQICHDNPPQNGAPVPLVSYGDVTAQASSGEPMHREMYQRVSSDDAPMPPPPMVALTSEEIDIFKTWTREGAPEGEPPYSWYRDVQPIVSTNCLGCHSDPPMNQAPFPLVAWENTQVPGSTGRPVHELMAERVDSMARPMPPTGQLPIGQINLIRAWSRIGAPRGAPNTDGGVPDVGMPGTPSPLDGISAPDQVSTGYVFLEGPDWSEPDQILVFADVLGSTIYRLSPPDTVSAIRSPSSRTNGVRFDQNDQLVAAEHESRAITRMNAQGAVETIVDRYEGNRFNSPNDLAIRLSDGTIYFTDPPLGLDSRPRELPFNGLFRISPGGSVTAEWQGPEGSQPNGLELSPDERTLYLSDTTDAVIRAFDVDTDGSLGNERIFAYTEAEPDGIAPDEDGNLFVATSAGVQVFAANGWLWGLIPMPERPTNLAFGGADRRTLYVTTITSLYAIAVQIPGTRWSRGTPDGGANPLEGVGPAQAFGPSNYQFLEGPDWDRANGRLVFSDIPGNTVYEHRPPDQFAVLRANSNMTNGLFVEPSGSILMCEHGSRSLTRMGTDLQVTPVVEDFNGMRLNSPNDVTVRSDGTIYFSDPDYGLVGENELGFHGVFRLTPQGALTAEWQAPLDARPNGLVFSPDERELYVTDSENGIVYRFQVAAGGALMGMAPFVNAMGGTPDGLAVDRDGNVYLASGIGIEVYAPDGTHWGNIPVPVAPSNLVFGGAEMRTLFITTPSQLYRVDVPIPAP